MIAQTHIDQLKQIAGDGAWTQDPETLAPHLTEWRGKYYGKTPLMLLPKDTETIAAILDYCQMHRIPVVPQGGNTGLVGGSLPGLHKNSEILLNTKYLNKILNVDTEGRTLTVEAGATIHDVQQAAQEAGLYFPLSLASEGSCTVGGTISTNAGGIHVMRYGSMRSLILGLEAVLPGGSIYSNLSGLHKDNTGYKLDQLIAGAEGTLGIVTKAVLKLYPPETYKVTAWLSCRTPAAALDILNALRTASSDRVSAFELIPDVCVQLAQKHIADCTCPLETSPGLWHIVTEIGTPLQDSALEDTISNTLEKLMDADILQDGTLAKNEKERAAFWRLRESLSEAQKREGGSIKHDIAVPVASIPDFIAVATDMLETRYPGCRVTPFGHMGDGNLHFNVLQPIGMNKEAFLANWDRMNRDVHDIVVRYKGSISAEHGIGSMKVAELGRTADPATLSAMRVIKRALDPHTIMNPGVLFDLAED